MSYVRTYSIRKNRLKHAWMQGMALREDGTVAAAAQSAGRFLFLGSIDGAQEEARWGRFAADIRLDENMAFIIRAFAADGRSIVRGEKQTAVDEFLRSDEVSAAEKLKLFAQAGAVKEINKQDILLYELQGRYLWICIEIIGNGQGTLGQMKVTVPGDNFMNTFPEVYQEWDSFFHRYLSIFSSVYNDFQDEIEHADELLDLDTAPPRMLELFAGWMGLDVRGNFLPEDRLRRLVKEAYRLNRMKGTRRVLERLTELVLGERAIILEKNILDQRVAPEERQVYDKLYGQHAYCVTLLIKNPVEESRRSQLFFLIQQFVPVRCELNLVFLEERSNMDTYCYLDGNAQLHMDTSAALDVREYLDDRAILSREEGTEEPALDGEGAILLE